MTIDEMNVLITAQTREFDKKIEGVNSKIDGMVSRTEKSSKRVSGLFTKIGAVVSAALITAGMVNFGKQAIEMSSDVQEVQNVVDTAFGAMSYMAEDFASTAIEQFGMSELSAKQAASTYMAMSKGMGMAQDAAAKMAIDVAGLTGDVASFYNISQDLASVKLKAIWTGETEGLKDLGVVMTQANLQQFAYRQGIKKTIDKLSQAEMVQLRYQYVTDQLSLAQGDFAKTSGSWANQTRILSERWKQFMVVAGNGLVQVLTPVVQFLNTAMQKLIEFSTAVGQIVSKLFGQSQQQSDIANSTQAAADAEGDLAANTKQAGKAAKGALASFDELNVLTKSDDADTAVVARFDAAPSLVNDDDSGKIDKLTSKFDGLVSKIQKTATSLRKVLSPSFDAWGKAFEGLKEPVSSAFAKVAESTTQLWNNTLLPFGGYIVGDFRPTIANGFSETFAPIFGEVMPVLISEFANDYDFACKQVSRITDDILYPAFEFAKGAATDVFGSIRKSWDEHGKGILDGFEGFKESLRKIWDKVYTTVIQPVVENIGKTISWLWDEHLKPMWDNIIDFLGSVGEFVFAFWNTVLAPLVDFIITRFGPPIMAVVSTIGDVVGTIIAWVSDLISGIVRALSGVLDFLTGVFTGDWEKAWNGIAKFFDGIWQAIWGTVKFFVNLIIDGINGLWRGIYAVVKGIVDSVGKIAGALGDLFGQDWHFSMPANPPTIPKLADGGLAYGPTLSLIGEGKYREAVLPLNSRVYSEIASGINRSGGGSDSGIITAVYDAANIILRGCRDISPILQVDGVQLGRVLYDPLVDEWSRRGVSTVRVV